MTDYVTLRAGFRWELPQHMNIGVLCADRHPADALALIEVGPDGQESEYTFGDITALSNALANGLRGIGLRAGDRIGIVLPQRLETGIAHLATYKLGGIAVPMSTLFGPQALEYRMGDAGVRAVITDTERLEAVSGIAAEVGDAQVIVVDGKPTRPHRAFWDLIEQGSRHFNTADTSPDTPALLIYTSGTTGAPKGALHAHRALIGHIPGFVLSHNHFPQPSDRLWSPADWAWIGGLMNALMMSWYHGRPVVAAHRRGFDPEWALDMMTRVGVRNAFLPPTALKMMRKADVRDRVPLRSLMSGGEPLGSDIQSWGRETFGVTINEVYGQTEANYVVGNSFGAWDVRPGSMGRAYPGHEVAVLSPDGEPVPAGQLGEIAIGAHDPVIFLEYWGRPDATQAKYSAGGRWLRTGDLARLDEDGYLWFQSRTDDVINSAGYRIGPGEIEECLAHHPAVVLAAVVGVPDPLRGQAVKAFVQLAKGHAPSAELEDDIRQLVRSQLAAYEYPREIEFIDQIPLTTTGKVLRAALREQ